jgi:predicted metalloprotease with PDZ domain
MVTAKRKQKYWWQSKTVWLGILTVAGAVLTAVLPAGPLWSAGLLAGIGALNVALRVADQERG